LKTANIVGKELNAVVRGMGWVSRVLLQPTVWCWVGVECSYALKGEEMNFLYCMETKADAKYVVVKRMAKLLWFCG